MAREIRLVGATVVTMDGAASVFDPGEVAYDPGSGRITYVGPVRGPLGSTDFNAAGYVLLPGLVDAHAHSAMTLLRGWSDDLDLHDWLQDMRRFELRMTATDLQWGLQLALVEMLRNGTTTFADMFHWDAALLDSVVTSGMRVLAAPSVFTYEAVGFPAASPADGREMLAMTDRLARDFAGDEQVRLAFGPHAPYTCPSELLKDVAASAAKLGIGIHIHLSETAREVADSLAAHGRTPIQYAADLGLFEVPVLAAHAVHATEADIQTLARAGAAVAHNPVSNLKLAAGIAPALQMREAGVTVGLGTDSVASNNSLDMFEEIKTGALVQRGKLQSAAAAPGATYLDMATAAGARAVGFPEAGSLEPGKFADFVLVATDVPHAVPMHNVTSYLCFAARGSDVRHVFIGGKQVVADGVVTTLDEAEIRAQVAATTARISEELTGA